MGQVMIMKKSVNQTAIILLDGKFTEDNEIIKNWFKQSRFLTNETNDIFEVIEEISDFTVVSRPDVVLLEVDSLKDDFFIIRNMMRDFSEGFSFPIFALNAGNSINEGECFEGNFFEVRTQLDKVFPQNTYA